MKAIVIGATGLVGNYIVKKLLDEKNVNSVLVLARRSTGIIHAKLQEKIVNFDRPSEWTADVTGDVLYSALGTTLKTVGTKEAQYKIDHDYQYNVAKAAAFNGVRSYVLISSVNAASTSPFFYLKMKGELEDKVMRLPFSSINILRPGPLKGHREKARLNEVFSVKVLDFLPVNKVTAGLKPVHGERVADVAVKAGIQMEEGKRIVGPGEILRG